MNIFSTMKLRIRVSVFTDKMNLFIHFEQFSLSSEMSSIHRMEEHYRIKARIALDFSEILPHRIF